MKTIKKLFAAISAMMLSMSVTAITAFADNTSGATAPTVDDGVAKTIGFIDTLKEDAKVIVVAILGLAIIGIALTCASGKQGLEKAKPWGIGIIVAAVILLAGEGLITGFLNG